MSIVEIQSKPAPSFDGRRNLKWKAVKEHFVEAFRSGQYGSGDILPSEHGLCDSFGVARNTIRQALRELEKEGLVNRIKGSGAYVSNLVQDRQKPTLQAFGLVIPEIRRSLFPSLARGFDSVACDHHQQTLICNTDYDIDKQGNIILQLLDKQIAGVAIVPPTLQAMPLHQIRPLQINGVPLVFCHRRPDNISAPLITWDHEKVGRIAGQAFLEKGHRDIMFWGVYRYSMTEAYARGLQAVLSKAGLTLPSDRIFYGPQATTENHTDEKEAMIRNILRKPDRPTAIFCSDDNEAERVYWAAVSEGLSIPQDLSIIGFGGNRRDSEFRKRLVSVTVDEFQLGAKAAEFLAQMNAGKRPKDSDERYLVDLQLTGSYTLGSVSSLM